MPRRADKLKVGFIYLGPVGDFGWTYQHEVGRQGLVEGCSATRSRRPFSKTSTKVPIPSAAIEQLARSGHKLIFTTSFGYMDPTLKVAKKYPNVIFEHATGYKRDKNVSTYSGRFYEGRYIQGQIAAKMSKSGVLGYIGSFPIPEVISGINSTMLGAQSINPNIKVKIIWVNTWFDPGKEADAAKALLDQGADVIMQHTDSPAAMQVAATAQRARVRPGLRHDQVRAESAAHRDHQQLGALLRRPRASSSSTASGRRRTPGAASSPRCVVMAPYTNMPDDVKKMAKKTEAAIVAGTLHPFKCPVIAQDGTTVECKGGKHLDDGQILGMNFYVKGIDDKLPGK